MGTTVCNYGPSIHRFCLWKTRCGIIPSFYLSFTGGMFVITILYISLRTLGYLKFGAITQASIIHSLSIC